MKWDKHLVKIYKNKKIGRIRIMRERKYVKFRVDMYEDTKFKIIDMKPERDVIHYIWNRLVLLAGKGNLEGELFLSKNIQYTIETLAIEFNRDASQIKIALEVFIELEMLELIEGKVYKVKNFAKHQNIKVQKKELSSKQVDEANNDSTQIKEPFSDEFKDSEHEEIIKASNNDITETDAIEVDKKGRDNLLEYRAKPLESKKSKRGGRRNKRSNLNDGIIGDIMVDDEEIADTSCFVDGERSLEKGEESILDISFV
jgi:predicted phage replisome organizer